MILSGTAFNRPDYLHESLESWRKVEGISEATMIWNVEPDNALVAEMCDSIDFCDAVTVINPKRYGVLSNAWWAFERGFALDDFVVLIEDDVIVSTDVLRYLSHCDKTYRDDPSVFAVCSFQLQAGSDPHQLVRGRFNMPPPVGFWKDRWTAEIRDEWDHDYSKKGWDMHVQKQRGTRVCISPEQSRAQHIGEFGGTHCTADMFPDLLSRSFLPEYPEGEFSERPVSAWHPA